MDEATGGEARKAAQEGCFGASSPSLSSAERSKGMPGTERDRTDNAPSGTAAADNEGDSNMEHGTRTKYAKLVATVVSLFLLGLTASVALADDPFSALGALTGSTTTTTSTDTTAATTAAGTTTTATTTTSTAATAPSISSGKP